MKKGIKIVGTINQITLSHKSKPEDGVGNGNQQCGVRSGG